MDNIITSALIGAGAVLIAAALPYTIDLFKRRCRLQRFLGVWQGRCEQDVEGQNIAGWYDVSLRIINSNKIYFDLKRKDIEFNFENNLKCKTFKIDGDYGLFTFKSKSIEVRQFGALLLKISADGREINGKFVGFGKKSEQLVNAKLMLNRIGWNNDE